jgi:putative ABC transport system permease protein
MENIVYGFITPDTLAQLGEEPHLDQLKIVVAENRLDEGHIRQVAGEVSKLVADRGRPVTRVDIPPPGKHPHTDIMGLLLLSMAAFGLFALLLSGVIVVNLLSALMASQVRQIGVMKVAGGSSRRIAQIYFAQAALLGVAAILLSLPAGILGSRALCRYMALLLNFDINSYAVPVWVYLSVAAVGTAVPVLAAAYPVRKGSNVSVREALSDFGVSHSAFGTSAFDRALAGVSGPARPLLFAVPRTWRSRKRSVSSPRIGVRRGEFILARSSPAMRSSPRARPLARTLSLSPARGSVSARSCSLIA